MSQIPRVHKAVGSWGVVAGRGGLFLFRCFFLCVLEELPFQVNEQEDVPRECTGWATHFWLYRKPVYQQFCGVRYIQNPSKKRLQLNIEQVVGTSGCACF